MTGTTPPPEGCVIEGLSGQTVTRQPGSVNGESLALKSLRGCSVYILDHSSEVEVSDCVDCELFIGPVDGPALFTGCSGCTAAVAAQQFQARRCADTSFALFCATAPAVADSTDLTFTCWTGAYPGLAAHFRAAGLDPTANAWDKVHDASAEGGDAGGEGGEGGDASAAKPPTFKLVRGLRPWWEVPLAGGGACENPVPADDGSAYEPSAAVEGGGGGGSGPAAPAPAAPAAPPPPIPPIPLDAGAAVALTPSASLEGEVPPPAAGAAASNGGPPPAPAPGGGGGGEHPRLAAMKAAARERLAAQEAAERAAAAETVAKASAFLAAFYKERDADKARRAAAAAAAPGGDGDAAAARAAAAAGKPAGATVWERIASLVDFDAPPAVMGGKAVDLARAKAALATAREKNLPA